MLLMITTKESLKSYEAFYESFILDLLWPTSSKNSKLADKNFELLKENPHHPSLHTKKVGKYWSARIGKKFRTIAVEVERGLLWIWIGTHAEYDSFLK